MHEGEMIRINLLPKQYQKRSGGFALGKQGKYAIAAVAGVIIMLGGITFYQMHQIDELEGQMEIARSRTMQLQQDIQLVDALMDIKNKITNRLDAVERLDRHRSTWVRILEDLSRNIPEFVWLTNFVEKAPKPVKADTSAAAAQVQQSSVPTVRDVELEGYTFTLNALANFMIKMMRSDYFDEVDLASVEEIAFGEQKAYNFKMSCQVHYLSDDELEKTLAQAAENSNAG
jgi:Tfp pilus assembly protein PilN